MQFLYPTFLWALFLLAIPIIIHLFYFQRFKKVEFTNVRFLKELQQETNSRNRLKHILILLARLLALSALIFAFAQPYISDNNKIVQGASGVSIYIDNSFSMSNEREGEALIQIAKKKALEIADSYNEIDQVQIITNDFEGKHQKFLNQEEIKSTVDEIQISPQFRDLSSIINRQKQIFKNQSFDNRDLYILSDFQTAIMKNTEIDSNYQLYFLPIQSVQEDNISIDSAYFIAGNALINQSNQLNVVVTNYSNSQKEDIRLSLTLDGQERPVATVSLNASESKEIEVQVSPTETGWQEATVKIEDYPINFDDNYNFSFYVKEKVNVMNIHQANSDPTIDAVFRNIDFFNLQSVNVSQLQYDQLNQQDLIILNDLPQVSTGLASGLQKYLQNGGKVAVFHPENATISDYNNWYQSLRVQQLQQSESKENQVGQINENEFEFTGVFEKTRNSNVRYPLSYHNFNFSNFQNRPFVPLMKYRDGSPFLLKSQVGDGFLYQCATGLNKDDSDFVNNPEIFVPLLYKMSLNQGGRQQIAYTIGKDQIIPTNLPYQEVMNLTINGQVEFIPGIVKTENRVLLNVNDQIQEAGFYTITKDEENQGVLAFNYDNTESKMTFASIDELNSYSDGIATVIDTEQLTNVTEFISERRQGIPLWRWFLLSALIFLLIETILIRLIHSN